MNDSRRRSRCYPKRFRIKDARLARVPPPRRPHYRPIERMAILELRAARGWNVSQVASTFLLTPLTIGDWMKRLDESGPARAAASIRNRSNRFRWTWSTTQCKGWGRSVPPWAKRRSPRSSVRAGLHIGITTVGRILKEKPVKIDSNEVADARTVTAKRPNHVWHVDLTTVPTGRGFWTAWLPFSVPQCWPFCWWVAVVVDHFFTPGDGMRGL